MPSDTETLLRFSAHNLTNAIQHDESVQGGPGVLKPAVNTYNR